MPLPNCTRIRPLVEGSLRTLTLLPLIRGAVAAIWIRGSMDKKTERLVGVARMYYEQDRTQNEIAGRYGISRPMVSKLLKEARDRGIVSIRICAPQEESAALICLSLCDTHVIIFGVFLNRLYFK